MPIPLVQIFELLDVEFILLGSFIEANKVATRLADKNALVFLRHTKLSHVFRCSGALLLHF